MIQVTPYEISSDGKEIPAGTEVEMKVMTLRDGSFKMIIHHENRTIIVGYDTRTEASRDGWNV